MSIKISQLLKKCHPIKGFVYANARLDDEVVMVEVRERKGAKARCGKCRRPAPGYDRQPMRLFQFIPIWNIVVFLCYAPRRVECRHCGIKVEWLPWASGKHTLCDAFRLFLAQWARLLSWREVANRFAVGWAGVYHSVEWVVDYGMKHRDLTGITAIGVDEIKVRKGRVFWTLVYQIDEGVRRLLWVGKDRTKETFTGFFEEMGKEVTGSIRYVCSDMWRAYLAVVKEQLGKQAVHVIDRFHVVKRLLEAVDEIRRKEAKTMAEAGMKPLLKKMRYAFMKRRAKWTRKEKRRMRELEGANLAVFHARLLVEQFDHFWSYRSVAWAEKFLTLWTAKVGRSRRDGMEPLKNAARTIKKHHHYLLNFIRSKGLNSGVVEGLNRRLKTATNRSYGFRTDKALKLALFHELGKLPLPKFTHSFF